MNGGKTEIRCFAIDDRIDVRVIEFRDRATRAADQELAAVWIVGIGAAYEGIERIKSVHQVGLDEKFQGPVHGWWRCVVAIALQTIQNVIRTNRLMAVPYQLKYAPPLAGETQAFLPANQLCGLYGLRYTMIMVVLPGREFARRKSLVHRVSYCEFFMS